MEGTDLVGSGEVLCQNLHPSSHHNPGSSVENGCISNTSFLPHLGTHFPLPWVLGERVLSCYNLACAPWIRNRHHQEEWYVFGPGDPEIHLHLWLESREGGTTQVVISTSFTKQNILSQFGGTDSPAVHRVQVPWQWMRKTFNYSLFKHVSRVLPSNAWGLCKNLVPQTTACIPPNEIYCLSQFSSLGNPS